MVLKRNFCQIVLCSLSFSLPCVRLGVHSVLQCIGLTLDDSFSRVTKNIQQRAVTECLTCFAVSLLYICRGIVGIFCDNLSKFVREGEVFYLTTLSVDMASVGGE